jgi:hypothetical protein
MIAFQQDVTFQLVVFQVALDYLERLFIAPAET